MGINDIGRERMVRWLAPAQLLRTGFDVVISIVFGKHADKRLFEPGVSSLSANYYAYSKQGFCAVSLFKPDEADSANGAQPEVPDELWLNYVADVGDGFDSTYSIASCLTRPEIRFNDKHEEDENGNLVTRFEDVLVFGGDEVYPIATVENYENRLKKPYEFAIKANGINEKQSTIFAIPGNHDWYDSLALFSEIFCEKRSFAGQKTLQDRSYFALKLIKGWWLFATDLQLGNSLDKPQKDYFTEAMKHVGEDDKIILCSAVPYWLNAGIDETQLKEIARLESKTDAESVGMAKKLRKQILKSASQEFRTLEFFEGHILKRKTRLFLSGDLHHYCRYEFEDDGLNNNPAKYKVMKYKITAGGGGAFLHPTQIGNPEMIGTLNGNKFRKKCSFPDEGKSLKLFFTNFHRIALNWTFGLIPAVLYMLLAYAFRSDIGRLGFLEALITMGDDLLNKPLALVMTLIVVGGLIFFADSKSLFLKLLLGSFHVVLHLSAFSYIYWIAERFVGQVDFPYAVVSVGMLAAAIGLGGWIAGSIVMAIYMLVSIVIFKTHSNIAYSAEGIEQYKNFLRIKIDSLGRLTIYSIGLEKTCKRWVNNKKGRRETIEPAMNSDLAMRLIGEPIVIE